MKTKLIKGVTLSLAVLLTPAVAFATPVVNLGGKAGAPAKVHQAAPLVINGTGSTGTFTVNPANLADRITLTATAGFEVYPTVLPATAENVTVRVTLKSSLPTNRGMVILRSGDFRAEVPLVGYGSALEQKALNANPVVGAGESEYEAETDKFNPGANGYTIEFRAKFKRTSDAIEAYAVTPDGGSFKAYVEPEAMGLYNSTSKVGFDNPLRDATGGMKKFYNNDDKFHTYRYAVTSDKRVFVYRDGVQVATLRTGDYGNQPEWATGDGAIVENLLKNGNFEGETNFRSDSLMNKVEGWIVDPIDRYNCTYTVPAFEINNDLDHYNHAMKMQRYNWNDGWGAGTVSQIVDVAPNSTYSLSFLAQGGMDKKSGTNMTSVKIEEVQDAKSGNSVTITNQDNMQEYGLNYTTSANCRQIKVILYNERFLNGGGWGSSPQPAYFDQMVLSGTSRVLPTKTGFELAGGEVEYFTYDVTGAYAPLTPEISADVKNLTFNTVGETKTLKVNIANLPAGERVKITPTVGFSVYPEMLAASGEVRVTLNSSLADAKGRLIMRCGDLRSYVGLASNYQGLEEKDITDGKAIEEAGDTEHFEADGFTPGENGYTVEFKAKFKNDYSTFNAYAVTHDDAAFSSYIESDDLGLYNGDTKIAIANPATNAAGGLKKFYNNDGKFHIYRYAVTSDKRVVVYRDGIRLATLRTADYGHQPEWLAEEGPIVENLIKNGTFEGEYNYRQSDSLLNMVEGWRVDPIDTYNCNYDVENKEINNEFDHDNHAMKLKRYNWNDGWAAGTVSQIVDVVPGQTYSLSFLAMGGRDNKSGTNMSSMKIQEVQDSKLGTSVTITNEDAMQEYGMSYTTSANCSQIKVIMYNERFLNGGGWGSSPQNTYYDNVVLSGMSRKLDQLIGYDNHNTDLEYFVYDVTGAYAPKAPGFGDNFSGVEAVDASMMMKVEKCNEGVVLHNVGIDVAVEIFDAMGKGVYRDSAYEAGAVIRLPQHGVYIINVVDDGKTKSAKVIF